MRQAAPTRIPRIAIALPRSASTFALVGDDKSPAAPVQVTAADHFLGPLANEVTVDLDVEWQRNAAQWWPERHEQERGEEDKLTDLEGRRESLEIPELWTLARLTDSRRGSDAAEPYLRQLLTRMPRHVSAAYTLGYNLLDRDDEAGMGFMETALDGDPEAIPPGSRTIASFLRRQGRTDEAERYEQRAATSHAVQKEAAHERDSIYKVDSFLPHEVNAEALMPITDELARHPRVKQAWLARKALKHKPESPVFVLGFDTGYDWRGAFRAAGIPMPKAPPDPLVDELARTLPFPGEAFVVPLHRGNAWLKKKLKKVAGAKVFQR